MTWADLFRCRLSMWLDAQKDRIDAMAECVSPDSHVWEMYDEWARKRGHHDWMNTSD